MDGFAFLEFLVLTYLLEVEAELKKCLFQLVVLR